MNIVVDSPDAMKDFGAKIGSLLSGGEVIELLGDVGAGKTTFTKGLAVGLGISEDVQSPTFTISRVYSARDGLALSHYDFYRLNDAGIMAMEIASAIEDAHNITVVEWAESVAEILPESRIKIRILPQSETMRKVEIEGLELWFYF